MADLLDKVLFLDSRDDSAEAELTKNVHILIAGLYNDEVRRSLQSWVPDFIEGVPSKERFENRLHSAMC